MTKWHHTFLKTGHPFKSRIVIEREQRTKSVLFFFKRTIKAMQRSYYGDGTVWYEEDEFGNLHRTSTYMEHILDDIQATAEKMDFDRRAALEQKS